MADAFSLPPGHGFSRLSLPQLQYREDLLGVLQLFEHPRKRGERRYILGVDVSDGIGKDRSVVAVHRMGTLEEPEEQVALYVADSITPVQLAYVVDALMRLYPDADGYEAMAAIECNNHGLSTQDTLQLHLGATHFYRWEYLDAGDPQRRYSTKIGWVTTPRTRPMLLDKLYEALTTTDPVTHSTDLLIHSAMLRAELADFQTEGALWEASAARGAHDDIVMATAIAHYVAWRLQGGEQEPLAERRSRMHAEQAARAAHGALAGQPRRDWRNTGCTAEEWRAGVDPDELGDQLYDERHAPVFIP
jgi:hypothetical protein